MVASNSQERNMSGGDVSDSSIMKLQKCLIEYGTELLKPCDFVEELLRKLDKLDHHLSNVIQDHKNLVQVALRPAKEALIANELIRHPEMDVRVSVASCIGEIIRITAPDEPYEEDQMKEFFQLAICAFEKLDCMAGRAYSKAVSILKTISCSQSCVLMLDLQLHNDISKMFELFLYGIRIQKILEQKLHLVDPSGELQGSSTEAPTEKNRSKIFVSIEVMEGSVTKTLASQSSPTPFKGKGLCGEVSDPQLKKKCSTSKKEASKKDMSRCYGEEVVGCRIKVWWPLDKMFYEGKITSFDHLYGTHQVDYDDGDREILNVTKECWRLIGHIALH